VQGAINFRHEYAVEAQGVACEANENTSETPIEGISLQWAFLHSRCVCVCSVFMFPRGTTYFRMDISKSSTFPINRKLFPKLSPAILDFPPDLL
jgi:hypothetical protein